MVNKVIKNDILKRQGRLGRSLFNCLLDYESDGVDTNENKYTAYMLADDVFFDMKFNEILLYVLTNLCYKDIIIKAIIQFSHNYEDQREDLLSLAEFFATT